ncbi:MAG: hypothetical protein M3372_01770 [Verrucomicrobiota bacterium]|nr:hypothetical protein [Verrucomicrobiota bacterium]
MGLVVLTLSIAAPAQAGEIDGTDADSPARLAFTEKDLPRDEKDPAGLSEIDEVARRLGFNYARVAQRAAEGDARALKQFFAMAKDVAGAAAESYTGMPTTVYHLLGDEKFAQFLNAQPLAFRMMVRNSIVGDGLPAPAKVYLPRYFPETAKALFRREIVAWPSPDKRFAIRKAFSDEFDLLKSKVERAEVIEQKTGQVLCDLTGDDIGTGWEREGEVLWSPDSKRFAYRSSDLTQHEGNLFSTPRPPPKRKQTAVYQLSGESFMRVELPLNNVPGREKDEELKRAILGHEYTEPERWQKPNVLLLERHEYYETLKPITDSKFESIHPLARWYRITATISPEGKAAVAWKLRQER